jgi:hypothetical protein
MSAPLLFASPIAVGFLADLVVTSEWRPAVFVMSVGMALATLLPAALLVDTVPLAPWFALVRVPTVPSVRVCLTVSGQVGGWRNPTLLPVVLAALVFRIFAMNVSGLTLGQIWAAPSHRSSRISDRFFHV